MQGLGPEADDLRAEHIFGMAVDGYVLMGDQTFSADGEPLSWTCRKG